MPRSFLVKKVKCDDDRAAYHSYKIRDLYDDSVESVKAVAPYTPSIEPLAVTINNGKSSTTYLDNIHEQSLFLVGLSI